jgi:hypothetical protein
MYDTESCVFNWQCMYVRRWAIVTNRISDDDSYIMHSWHAPTAVRRYVQHTLQPAHTPSI